MDNPPDRRQDNANGEVQRLRRELDARLDQDEELQRILKELASKVDSDGEIQPVDILLLSKTERWAGPLPPPELLGGYEDIHSGLANRIVLMAEREQEHQMSMQAADQEVVGRMVRADIHHAYLGTVLGFIFAMAFLGVGGWLIANGHWKSGLPLGLIPPGILFGMFAYRFSSIFGKHPADSEDEPEKREETG